MRKVVNVIVAGVPTAARDVQEWRSKATFKIGGRKPTTPVSKLFQSFSPGVTDELRERVVRGLSESGALARRDITASVEDAGEFLLEGPYRFNGSVGLDESEMTGLCREFAAECSGRDLVVLVGGDHAGGLLLYGFEGKVARFDEHSDACATPATCQAGVTRNNYVCVAIRAGLKLQGEITCVGVREGESPCETVRSASGAGVLDIDLDVLTEKHGIKTRYGKGNLSPDDLIHAVRLNKPRAIGFFEATPGDEKAIALVEKLVVEAAIARARKA